MLRKLRIRQKNDFPIKKRVQTVKKKNKKQQEMAKSMKGYHEINENQENMQGKNSNKLQRPNPEKTPKRYKNNARTYNRLAKTK